MRKPPRLTRKAGPRPRSGRWPRLLGGCGVVLLVAGIVSVTLANHSTTTWDFSTPSSYTYDANKIAVENGVAHLRKSFTVTHVLQADFDGSGGNTGTYSGTVYNTGAPAAGVKLSAPPTAGTYTSPVIDAGVATTTWKTLSHVRDLQQAAPPATFGARTSITTVAGTIQQPSAADLDRDGAVDVIAADTAGTDLFWYKNDGAANPSFTQLAVTRNENTVSGLLAACAIAGQSSSMLARHDFADLDNDLDIDIVEPGQQSTTVAAMLYVNPAGASPQCFDQWLLNSRRLEDLRLANINGDTYSSTDPFKAGRPIVDIVGVDSRIGTGTGASPSGGVFWFRNDGTVAPDAPVFGTRSIDSCTVASGSNTSGPTTVAVGDLNNDGFVDVVAGWPFTTVVCTRPDGVTTRASTPPQILGYLSSGGDPPTWTTFTIATIPTGGSANYSADLWVADINGDGFPDVIHANTTANTITWYKNPCTATPCTPTSGWTAFTVDASATGVSSLAVADLDLNGRLDIVANSSTATAGVVWYQNNGGTPVTWSKGTFTTTAASTGVVVANLQNTGDRAPDVIAANTSGAGTIDRWLNTLSHSNIRIQVRTWSQGDNTCTTPTGSFVGPDGSAGTFYTSTSETLRAADNQCFQYRVFFFTNSAGMNPNLQSVTVSYERSFFTDSPSIQNNTGVAYSRLTDFVETLGPGHAGGVGSAVKYQLCKVGDTCYYWTGSLWVSASGAAQSNDAATVKASIGFFDDYAGHAAGTQSSTLYFKAFLVSDGTKQVELDAVAVQPDLISAVLTNPVGGESWVVNQTKTLSWTYSCAGSPCGSLKLEYSTNGGGTWSLIANPVINGANAANGGCTVPGGSTGCYTWTIPVSAASATTKVRVVDNDTPVIAGASGNFTVLGTASVISPNGGETLTVNASTTITWSVTGATNVKLEYSKKGDFTDAATIVASAANGANGGCTVPGGATGCYPWTIPDAIATTVKVRVTDTANASLTDSSDNPFTITGSTTLTAPNGGQTFTVGDPTTITWSTLGNIPTAKLEYSTDGGSTWTLITASTTSTPATPPTLGSGSYAWTAPTATSAQFRIRVSDADTLNRPATSDISDANFTVKGTIAATSPTPGMVAGQSYTVGNAATIAWATTGTIATIKIEYSTNAFSDETQTTQVTASAANGVNGGCTVPGGSTGCYPWTLPDVASSTVKVRVSDARPVFSATVRSSSPNNFTVKGGLTVTSPVGTDVWKVGEVKTISWTSTGAGAIPTVNLEYSKNGLFTDTVVIATGVASGPTGGSSSWTVPDAIATTVKVRVKHPTDTTVSADSAAFSIKGSLALTAPAGGEVWAVGDSRTITWTSTGTLADVKIEYSRDNFAADIQPITLSTPAASGSFAWTVPDAISNTVKVRITSNSDATVTNASAANFKIRGSLTVTVPNGGETWIVGATQTITWTKTGTLADVKLEYSTDGGVTYPNLIAASTPASNLSYAWTVPDAISTTARVRITLNADATVTDASNGDFSIKGSLTLTSPNTGENWIVGSAQNITWTKTGSIANVKLEYSTDAGVTYPNLITASTSATAGTYPWTIPDVGSSGVKVRVTNTADTSVFDDSDSAFTIKGGLSVTAPVGTDVWKVGEVKTISWTSTGAGAIPTVDLRYSKNGLFTDTVTIAAGVASGPTGGSYSWTVADAIAATVKIRVKHPTDATVSADSAAFTIKGTLTLTAPVGGEAWTVGSSRNITWTGTGSIANVKVEYSKDNFVTPVLITASTSAAAGTYPWTIPDDISSTVKVRITDLNDATVTATSPANFGIKGSVTIVAPNGGEAWSIGSTQNITWTKTGTIGNVRLDYSTDGGLTYPNVITLSTPAASLSYSWTVPDAPTTQGRVKVTLIGDTSVNATSAGNFSIKGTVTVTAPNGGETWLVGESRNITWTRTGSIANVKLEYSTDGGATYPNLITASTPAASGSFAWTVPDAIGTGLRVRVTDAADATVSDDSNANFTIKGSLTLTAPIGGEAWTVGSTQTITWTKGGTLADVKLEYSTDGGTTYPNVITASTPAVGGSFAWTIPDAISATVKVRITLNSDTTVTSSSPGNFKIRGSLTVTAPNGGETWVVGQSQNITWSRTGSVANVKLEYSTDSGATYPNLITASTPAAAGSYAWTIPDAIGAAVRVRVTDAADATVSATSAANFAIKGSLTVTAPNGGESWTVGSTRTITWTKAGTFATVKLEYSTDNFATATVITASTNAALGSYAWTIPDTISSTVKVRVTNTADSTVFATSAANFKIVGSLTVTAPNGGEKWKVGSIQSITWTKTGSIANVKLEYSKDNFVTPVTIIASTPAAALSYAWTIPDAISTTVKVRITDASDAAVSTASAANFTIQAGFTISAPNGGEVWTVGASQNITWTNTGSVSNVKLEYSTDGGLTYPNLITASTLNTGSFSWTVPDSISATARVRVSDVNDASANATSAANFKIRGSFTITAPNGGEKWGIGTPQTITWTKGGSIPNVKLEYSTDGGATYPNQIAASAVNGSNPGCTAPAGTGCFVWTVPDTPSTQARIKITDTNDASVFDVSDANFAIRGSLTVTVPNGGESWVVGAAQSITWTKNGAIANVKLEYSTDGGVTYPNLITASTPAANLSYAWTVPDAIGTQVRVRITDLGDPEVTATSAANFTIKGSLTLTAPTGGEVLTVGGTKNITWTKAGTLGTVKLEYSTDGGASYPNLIVGTVPAADLTYAWTVPDAIGAQVRVRITLNADATVASSSAGNFTIKGALTLTAPNGGETWVVGQSQNITWSRTGSIANVKLEYSTNGGTTYATVITASTPAASGSYAWTIPDAIGTSLRVRISDASDATVSATSAANFTIKGSLTVTAPNGGESWTVGSTRTITWTRTGSIANVKLEYSTDNFATASVITASTDAAVGSYAWTIPDNISSTVKVRVTQTADSTVFATSAANFKIVGSLTLTAPSGGEKWKVGSIQTITWTRTGSIANVKLEYSKDNFVTPVTIIASTPAAALSYAWTIPDAISSTVKVRITDASDAAVSSASAANFTIQAGFTISAPNGGEVWTVGASQNIAWTTGGSGVSNVKLEYSTDGGSTYPNVIVASTPNTGTFAWTIPDSISSTARVRVSDVNDASANATSAANFKIRGKLMVTAPNGGESWTIGTSQTITWTTTGTIPTVKLEYSKDNFVTPILITASTANIGSYAFTAPNDASTTVKVRVTNTADATVFDDSDANFTLRGGFTVTSPNGGEEWVVGSTRQITWTTNGNIANVKLEYSKDNFVTATLITGSTANAGFYNWLIPNDISATVKVRVSDANDPGASDTSDANFKIKGGFVVTAPNGGEVWTVGTTQNITWTNTGTVANVKLEYSTDNFVTPVLIASSVSNTGTFNWGVPDSISNTVKVRVSDAADSTANDVSDANFKIRGGITVSAPNGGEIWSVGQSRTITWTTTGTVPNVRLEYSKDNFTSLVLIAASAPGTGSFTWTVPDDISSTVKVRVTDVRDSTVFDDSNANFKIQGALTLGSPNGGEKWTVGSAQSITWTAVGSIANVKLQYSKDNFATATLITASTPNTGSFNWVVPNDISSTVKVRVTDASDVTVFANSNANFKIMGGFTLTAPNGGEAWLVNTPRTITWNKAGAVSNVKLEYSTDGGATYSGLIAASANDGTNTANGGCTVADPANQGCYVWVVPDTVSGTVRVRISDAADPDAFDTSDANFKIRVALTLTSPNGGEQWLVGSTRTISWSAVGNLPSVKLEYAKDPYVSFTLITAAAPATPTGGNFAWTIPNDISSTNNVKVRVSDPNDPEANDLSDSPFKIISGFAVTSPNGGEQWTVGSVHPITWTNTGSVANVKIEYSTDDFATATVITASTPDTGSYNWTVPNAISATVKVRVSDVLDPDAKDVSDASFKIKSLVVVTSPNGGEKWNVASVHPITWTNTGTVANVKLEYSKDNFVTVNTIIASTPNTGSYNWTIPDDISTTVKVRVTDVADADGTDTSDANFKIQGVFLLTAPNGGEAWKINTTRAITWTTTGTIPNVKLEYSKDNFVSDIRLIAASAANSGSYNWLIPDDPTTTARIRVSDVNDATVLDTSDANFSIQGFFTITAPNGGEIWPVGSSQTIGWISGGTIPNVKLEYSTDNFATSQLITASTPNVSNVGGSFTWTVANAISSTVKIRVTDVNDPTVLDLSDANFTIRANFTVTAPNGGERWIANEDRTITWTTLGTVANVKLEYSTDNFATATVIVASRPNTGSYVWSVPDLPTVNVSNTNLRDARKTKVRVSDADAGHPAASDASDADFNVDYYRVKWLVRDVVLGTELSGLTVKHSVTVDGVETVNWAESVLTSPILRDVPANPKNQFGNRVPYKAVWTKSGYFDGSKDYVADGICRDELGNPNPALCPGSDLLFIVSMESTLVHTNKAASRFVYDSVTNAFTVDAWLERDGTAVPAVKEAKVEIFDPDGATPATPIATLDALCTVDHATHPHPAGLPASCPDDRGVFRQTWDFTGKTAKPYKIVTTLTMSSGSAFTTTDTLDAAQQVGIGRALGVPAPGSPTLATQVGTATSSIRTDIAGVQSTATSVKQDTTAIKQDTTAIKQDTTAIKQDTGVTIPGKLDALQSNVTAILESTSTTIPQKLTSIEAEVQSGLKPRILTRPTTVKRGSTITIQFQSVSGLGPVVTLYDPSGVRRVTNAPMSEIETSGIYKYSLAVDSAWPLGDYTVMVTESTRGSLGSLVLAVADADIPSIGADVAQIKVDTGTTIPALLNALQAKLATVDQNLNSTITSVNSIKLTVERTSADLAAVDAVVKDVQSRWGTLSAQQILDSITNKIVAVLGSSTDSATAATLFGRLAHLDADIAGLPAAVSASVTAAAAKVDVAAAKVESAAVTAGTAAGTVRQAATVATSAAAEVEKAAATAKSAAAEVIKAGEDVRAIGDKLDKRFKDVEAAASGAQGLAGQAAAAANDARSLIENVKTALGGQGKTETAYQMLVQLQASLNTLKEVTQAIPQSLDLKPMNARVQEIGEVLKQLSSANGINLDTMYKSISGTTTEVSEVKAKVERLKVLMELNRGIMEKVLEKAPVKKPEIKTWFEAGSVILKILVVNPSQTETQTIPMKVYLPREAGPKDIIDDLGDMKLEFDPDTGMYFVHAEVTLEAGQSVTKMVHMNDIWVFTEEQLGAFVSQAKETASQLEATAGADKAAALLQSVEKKVQEIQRKQAETAANPGEHIRAYRQGLTTITTIEQDLTGLDRLRKETSVEQGRRPAPRGQGSSLDSRDPDARLALGTIGSEEPPEGGAALGRSISMTTAWRLIFAILGFLAVLSAVFFMTWHRLLGITVKGEHQALPVSTGEGS
jgi:hypothetical protein